MALATYSKNNTIGRPSTRTRTTNHSRRGTVTLWTIQGLLAALFLFAGVMKLAAPADQLDQSSLPVNFLRFIGACETLDAFGLILPGVLRIRRELTPLAAAGLVIIMAGAVVVTVIEGPAAGAVIPFAVGVLASVVCYQRARRLREERPATTVDAIVAAAA